MKQRPPNTGRDESPTLSLRDQQRQVTRDRIITALRELVETGHPLDVTMAAVAARAGVSEPTLYRHFPNKRALFGALGSDLYRQSTAGVAPSNVDELVDFLPNLYRQFEQMEATTRWNLVAPPDEVVRPGASERLPILRAALGPVISDLPEPDTEALMRGLLLLTSPTSLLYWQDYLGVSVDEAATTAGWLIRRLAAA